MSVPPDLTEGPFNASGLDLHAGKDRIVILGASGWLGQSMLSILDEIHPSSVMAMGSHARVITVRDREWSIETCSLKRIRGFEPTVILDFAGITPGAGRARALTEAVSLTRQLMETFYTVNQLPTIRAALTVSSGAAVSSDDDWYGSLKREHEKASLSLRTPARSVVVLRAYSMSGPFVRFPRHYALSDFILSAAQGHIEIQADHRVWRRYVAVQDALRVSVKHALQGSSGIIETGGHLVEMQELASIVTNVVNPGATVSRPPLRESETTYASDNQIWSEACRHVGLVPKDLPTQVRETAEWLLGRQEAHR